MGGYPAEKSVGNVYVEAIPLASSIDNVDRPQWRARTARLHAAVMQLMQLITDALKLFLNVLNTVYI
jgi:hypothetical protein